MTAFFFLFVKLYTIIALINSPDTFLEPLAYRTDLENLLVLLSLLLIISSLMSSVRPYTTIIKHMQLYMHGLINSCAYFWTSSASQRCDRLIFKVST